MILYDDLLYEEILVLENLKFVISTWKQDNFKYIYNLRNDWKKQGQKKDQTHIHKQVFHFQSDTDVLG